MKSQPEDLSVSPGASLLWQQSARTHKRRCIAPFTRLGKCKLGLRVGFKKRAWEHGGTQWWGVRGSGQQRLPSDPRCSPHCRPGCFAALLPSANPSWVSFRWIPFS